MLTTVTVFNGESYESDWPGEAAHDCMEWFAAKLAEIPPEFKASAQIEIGSASGYEGDHSGCIEITYERPETDREAAERLYKENHAARNKEARDRQTLATLKAKYE